MAFRLRSRLDGLPEFRSTILMGPAQVGPVAPRLGALVFDDASPARPELRPTEPIELMFPAVRAWHIEGACLSDGFVVHRGAEIFADSSIYADHAPSHPAILRDFEARIGGAVDERFAGESAMVFHNEGGGTWGHLVAQNLPRALAYGRRFADAKLVLPREIWGKVANLGPLLARFGFGPERILLTEPDRTYRFGQLALVEFFYDFPRQIPHPAGLSWLSPWRFPKPELALFIERAAGTRLIANQDEVDVVLARHGIARLRLGALPVAEQIALWGRARVVIGTLGSDFANIAFGQPDTKLLVLSPDWFGDIFFYHLAAMQGMEWHELRCGRPAEGQAPDKDSAFVVDVRRLAAMLADILTAG